MHGRQQTYIHVYNVETRSRGTIALGDSANDKGNALEKPVSSSVLLLSEQNTVVQFHSILMRKCCLWL